MHRGDRTRLIRCVFKGNTVDADAMYGDISLGAGVSIWQASAAIEACLFVDNIAGLTDNEWGTDISEGAAIHSERDWSVEVAVENSTIVGNIATFGGAGGLSLGEGSWARNCVIWGNSNEQLAPESAATYSIVEGGWPGVGNTDQDPRFRSLGSFEHVLGPGSPGVDAGDPALEDAVSDWHPRWPGRYPDGPRSDMGAYGGPCNGAWFGFGSWDCD